MTEDKITNVAEGENPSVTPNDPTIEPVDPVQPDIPPVEETPINKEFTFFFGWKYKKLNSDHTTIITEEAFTEMPETISFKGQYASNDYWRNHGDEIPKKGHYIIIQTKDELGNIAEKAYKGDDQTTVQQFLNADLITDQPTVEIKSEILPDFSLATEEQTTILLNWIFNEYTLRADIDVYNLTHTMNLVDEKIEPKNSTFYTRSDDKKYILAANDVLSNGNYLIEPVSFNGAESDIIYYDFIDHYNKKDTTLQNSKIKINPSAPFTLATFNNHSVAYIDTKIDTIFSSVYFSYDTYENNNNILNYLYDVSLNINSKEIYKYIDKILQKKTDAIEAFCYEKNKAPAWITYKYINNQLSSHILAQSDPKKPVLCYKPKDVQFMDIFNDFKDQIDWHSKTIPNLNINEIPNTNPNNSQEINITEPINGGNDFTDEINTQKQRSIKALFKVEPLYGYLPYCYTVADDETLQQRYFNNEDVPAFYHSFDNENNLKKSLITFGVTTYYSTVLRQVDDVVSVQDQPAHTVYYSHSLLPQKNTFEKIVLNMNNAAAEINQKPITFERIFKVSQHNGESIYGLESFISCYADTTGIWITLHHKMKKTKTGLVDGYNSCCYDKDYTDNAELFSHSVFLSTDSRDENTLISEKLPGEVYSHGAIKNIDTYIYTNGVDCSATIKEDGTLSIVSYKNNYCKFFIINRSQFFATTTQEGSSPFFNENGSSTIKDVVQYITTHNDNTDFDIMYDFHPTISFEKEIKYTLFPRNALQSGAGPVAEGSFTHKWLLYFNQTIDLYNTIYKIMDPSQNANPKVILTDKDGNKYNSSLWTQGNIKSGESEISEIKNLGETLTSNNLENFKTSPIQQLLTRSVEPIILNYDPQFKVTNANAEYAKIYSDYTLTLPNIGTGKLTEVKMPKDLYQCSLSPLFKQGQLIMLSDGGVVADTYYQDFSFSNKDNIFETYTNLKDIQNKTSGNWCNKGLKLNNLMGLKCVFGRVGGFSSTDITANLQRGFKFLEGQTGSPNQFVIAVVGAGGGGGGSSPGLKGTSPPIGGAGGGSGGFGLWLVKISDSKKLNIQLSASGGIGGSDGKQDNDGSGGSTYTVSLTVNGQTATFTAGAGGGGTDGDLHGDNSYGGSGGSAPTCSSNASQWVEKIMTESGLSGCAYTTSSIVEDGYLSKITSYDNYFRGERAWMGIELQSMGYKDLEHIQLINDEMSDSAQKMQETLQLNTTLNNINGTEDTNFTLYQILSGGYKKRHPYSTSSYGFAGAPSICSPGTIFLSRNSDCGSIPSGAPDKGVNYAGPGAGGCGAGHGGRVWQYQGGLIWIANMQVAFSRGTKGGDAFVGIFC